jgi:predicted Fe-Mo cluster-binding NifX family protein
VAEGHRFSACAASHHIHEVSMNICIPTDDDQGLDSTVSGHFGSAPFFTIVQSDSGAWHCVPNPHRHHGGGACHPLGALEGHAVDAVVVGGMGRRALDILAARGIVPYLGTYQTVRETLDAFAENKLEPLLPEHACHGHADGERGRHGHGRCCG